MIRVLLICRWFPPFQHSGTLRNEGFVRYLPEFGMEVAVFTAKAKESDLASGPCATAILSDWSDSKSISGGHIVRAMWDCRKLPRWLKRFPVLYTMTIHTERHRLVKALFPPACEAVRSFQPDLIVSSFAPAETIYLGIALGKRFNIPVIADLRDPWSYAPASPYRHLVDFLFERAEERRVLGQCSRVIVTCRVAARLLEEQVRIPPQKIEVVENGYDEADTHTAPMPTPLEPGKFVIVHLGELAWRLPSDSLKRKIKARLGFDYNPLRTDVTTRSPKWVLTALERMIRADASVRDVVRLWFVGMRQDRDCPVLTQFPYPECIRVFPRVSSREAFSIAASADLLLLLQNSYFLNGRDYPVAIAAKTYTYMRAGRPILACLQPSEMAELVRKYANAEIVAPRDIDGIEKVLWRFLRARSQSVVCGSPDKLEHLSRRNSASKLAGIIKEVVQSDNCSVRPEMTRCS